MAKIECFWVVTMPREGVVPDDLIFPITVHGLMCSVIEGRIKPDDVVEIYSDNDRQGAVALATELLRVWRLDRILEQEEEG